MRYFMVLITVATILCGVMAILETEKPKTRSGFIRYISDAQRVRILEAQRVK